MDLHLNGEVSLTTGASRRLGRATALALAREGADVVMAACKEGSLTEVADEIRRFGRRVLTVTADAGSARDDLQALQPAGDLHLTSAPRSGLGKGFDTPIFPAQEHFLITWRRSGQTREFSGQREGMSSARGKIRVLRRPKPL